MTCTTASSTSSGSVERRVPVDRGRGVPLGRGGLRVEPGRGVGPDGPALVEVEARLRAARLDQRSARRQAPCGVGAVVDDSTSRAAAPARTAPAQRSSAARRGRPRIAGRPRSGSSASSAGSSRCPWARHHAPRWIPSAGSRPRDLQARARSRAASARGRRGGARRRSKPRSSRSIVGGGDITLRAVERRVVDRPRQLAVPGGAARLPLLEPFEVEQRAHLGVGVRHREQQASELVGRARARRRRPSCCSGRSAPSGRRCASRPPGSSPRS